MSKDNDEQVQQSNVNPEITEKLTDEELAMVAAGYVDLSPQVGDGFSSPGANDRWHLRATH